MKEKKKRGKGAKQKLDLTPQQKRSYKKLLKHLKETDTLATLEDVGEIFGVSRMRVCQLEKDALTKLGNILLQKNELELCNINIQKYRSFVKKKQK